MWGKTPPRFNNEVMGKLPSSKIGMETHTHSNKIVNGPSQRNHGDRKWLSDLLHEKKNGESQVVREENNKFLSAWGWAKQWRVWESGESP